MDLQPTQNTANSGSSSANSFDSAADLRRLEANFEMEKHFKLLSKAQQHEIVTALDHQNTKFTFQNAANLGRRRRELRSEAVNIDS